MHRETSTKYLGDILHNSGKTKFNILERSAKAHAILAEIRAILTEVPLGKYRTEAGLQLRQAMFVNGVLYNSETWQGLGTTDLTILENIDHQLMRFFCNGHAKTPVEFLYLETGCIQLNNMVSMGRIMYLHHILNRNDSELIKRVFSAQRESPTPGDFVELVKSDLQSIGEIFDENAILGRSKIQYKNFIKEKVRMAAFNDMKNLQKKHLKVMNIQYDCLKTQKYMTDSMFSNDMVKLLFNMHSSMTKGIKINFLSIFREDMTCRLKCSDPQAIDSQQHILTCSVIHENISYDESNKARNLNYNHIFGNLDQQREAVLVLAKLLEVREDILESESLPVGAHTGPESTNSSHLL